MQLLDSKYSVDQTGVLAKLLQQYHHKTEWFNLSNFYWIRTSDSPAHDISAVQKAFSHNKVTNTVCKSVVSYKGQWF